MKNMPENRDEEKTRIAYYIFTKFFLFVCLSKLHILVCQHARCDGKIWNVPWFYCVFWVFSYIIIVHSCLKCCICTKLFQTVSGWYNQFIISLCQIWLRVMEGYLIRLRFFGHFHTLLHVWNIISSRNFHKLSALLL